MPKQYSALEVSKWILSEAERQGIRLTPMQLQKLLYYVQGEYIGMTGKPLFAEAIEAWQHGPVVPEVYRAYKVYGRTPINPVPCEIPEDLASYIRYCVSSRGRMSAAELRNATHGETPYNNAENDGVISVEALRDFFTPAMYGPDEEDIYTPDYTAEEAINITAEQMTEKELDELVQAL